MECTLFLLHIILMINAALQRYYTAINYIQIHCLYSFGVCFFSPASNSLSFDFRLWCQKVSGITGSRNKAPKNIPIGSRNKTPQNYLQKLLWKTGNQEGICHPRKQFFRYFSNRYSSHRCAKTSMSGNIFFRYYTPVLSFASASFSYSHTTRNFPTLETRQSPWG